jgi:hypothetical protein
MRKIKKFAAGCLLGVALAASGETFENGLALEILSAWPIELALSWPSNFTHAVDMYFCDDLRTAQWEFFVAGEETGGLEALWITDLDSTNRTMGFYRPGDATLDTDGDLLPDDRERFIYKTDVELFDTDGDGAPDGWEIAYGFKPLLYADGGFDYDSDGLSNADEYLNGTYPNNTDSEDDGLPDGWEVAGGLDPLTDDTTSDPDGDGVNNLAEYTGGTHPQIVNVALPGGASGSLVFRYDDDGRLIESHLNNTSSELYSLTPAHNVNDLKIFVQ